MTQNKQNYENAIQFIRACQVLTAVCCVCVSTPHLIRPLDSVGIPFPPCSVLLVKPLAVLSLYGVFARKFSAQSLFCRSLLIKEKKIMSQN